MPEKKYGLTFLSKHLGIALNEMIAVGDGLNDLGMLKYVGCGVAMGNAIPEVKEVADEVIGSNAENGLAKAIISMDRGKQVSDEDSPVLW